MKISVFTSNQPRHIGLFNSLSKIADRVYAIQECNTVFPGKVKDFFDNSDVMDTYFKRVRDAETEVFGKVSFISGNVSHLAIKSGNLNSLSEDVLKPALDPFVLGMKSVKVAQDSLVERIANKDIYKYEPIVQDKTKEYRYKFAA